MAISPTEIIFSTEQQQALLGHAVTSEGVYEQCVLMGVTPAWFHSANLQSIWKALEEFVKENRGHHPTMTELRSTSTFKNDEAKIVTARIKALEGAIDLRDRISFDSISNELREWAKGQAFVKHMEQAADLYNRKDVVKAYEVASKMSMEIERINEIATNARCVDVSARSGEERDQRLAQKDFVLKFGVTYLDEATGGIGPNDIVLIGAKTGVGKTQLATNIAGYNAAKGKRVVLFALEAEKYEIERRIKFAVLLRAYKTQNPDAEELHYRDWRHGLLEDKLGQYETFANNFITTHYSNLRTIYKGWGDYGIHQLERDIMRLAPSTDLIIVDHLHYIDTEGQDTNREMKEVLQVLRDLALFLNKPIILLAHLRKSMGGRKNQALVPDNEDFHGSSDITKICTIALLLAPCYDNFNLFPSGIVPPFFCNKKTGAPERLWATYMRISKCRVDGGVVRYCGIGFYDEDTGTYRKEYALGRLTSADTVWDPEKYRPLWAQSGTLHMNSTAD
jgi:replicative DNA helicase